MTEKQLAHNPMTDERRQAIERGRSDGAGVYSPQEGVELHEANRRHPEWRLCQPMSAKGTPGKYLRTDTEEEFDFIEVVAIGVKPTRTWWGPAEFEPGRSPLCYSTDGRFGAMASGDGTPTQHPGLACKECPDRTDRPWLDDEKTKCKSGYLLALIDPTTGEGFTMRVNGKATRLGEYLGSDSVFRRAVIRLSSELVGSNYVPKHNKIRDLNEADIHMATSMFADFNMGNDDVDDDDPKGVEPTVWNQQEEAQATPPPETPYPGSPTPASPASQQPLGIDTASAVGGDSSVTDPSTVVTDGGGDDADDLPW